MQLSFMKISAEIAFFIFAHGLHKETKQKMLPYKILNCNFGRFSSCVRMCWPLHRKFTQKTTTKKNIMHSRTYTEVQRPRTKLFETKLLEILT
jgi:hypothetical protein